MLYNKVFFYTNVKDLLKILGLDVKIRPEFNNCKKASLVS